MTELVQRSEILDYETYEEERNAIRREILALKAPRRVHIGEHLTLLFENHRTVRYQIQEMIRAERIVRESAIEHEIAVYNELLGGPGVLGCTVLIEIEDPAVRDEKLVAWWSLPESIYLRLADGSRIRATFDERQRGDGRLSSVQYLKFDTGGHVPVAIGVDLPEFDETELSAEQCNALAEDLAAT